MFKINGHYFISDPTNLAFLNFSDFLKAKYIGSNLEIDIKPYLILIFETIKSNYFQRIFIGSFVLSDNPILNENNVKRFSENALELCYQNIFLLDGFYSDNISDIDIVCRT